MMIPNTNAYQPAQGTLRLLQIIESTHVESERLAAITELAQSGDRDAGRILIETFRDCMWRETKISLLRAMGPMQMHRTTEFLLRVASDQEDLAMAAEALLALGATADPRTGEFLLSILAEREHPLCREAVISLAQLRWFPCAEELLELLERPETEIAPGLLQYVILALGRRGQGDAWKKIERFLNEDCGGAIANASMIAAGSIGAHEALDRLRAFDTRYRFFADQLKMMAIERILLRSQRTVEDAISAVLMESGGDEEWQALRFLGEFPRAEAWEAFCLLGAEGSIDLNAKVRLVLYDPTRLESDEGFLLANWHAIDWTVGAGLVRLHAKERGDKFISSLCEKLRPEDAVSLLQRVRSVRAFTILAKIFTETDDSALRTKCVNAIVSQALMAGRTAKVAVEAVALLLELMRIGSGHERNRIVRALGELEHASSAFLVGLANLLKHHEDAYPSVYAALSRVCDEESARIILRRLRKIASDPNKHDEVQNALGALSRLGPLPEGEELPGFGDQTRVVCRRELLKILSVSTLAGYEEMITSALQAPDFQTRILALAAARRNSSPEIMKHLLAGLTDPNPCLVGRALDSICYGGSLNEHKSLLKWIAETNRDPNLALKALRSIRPVARIEYRTFIRSLDRLIAERKGVFRLDEVVDAAVNLCDNLALAEPLSRSRPSATADHSLDVDLEKELDGFSEFSETIKTVLRNAELTYKHSELFDDRVDKSTMVVQFVKSIDLLLQEKIGSKIFLDPHSTVIAKMQSRVVRLQLDDDQIPPPQVIKDLQCSVHFSIHTFPLHKLVTICREITSGKIVRDQYHTIDGLRAWAIILLVYCRRFKHRQVLIEPLLKMRDAQNSIICKIAANMNSLQETRNLAAHRGTLLHHAQLKEIRTYCFEVLRDLNAVL